MNAYRNALGTQSSPYLRQHKDNPVWWQPWGDEAFTRAKAENKPVFLSIGYSTCYWCHVMERDSFEDREVADLLNENFVCVKVDREEHPDVDQIYMEVVIGIHGHGGWPMSLFLTPDREPFWGGTFFYRDTFIGILKGMAESWKSDRAKVASSSGELVRFLQARMKTGCHVPIDVNVFGLALEQLFKRYDRAHGGFGGAPKFPSTQPLEFLLRAHAYRQNAAALEVVNRTLTRMACGGIFDHVGGGFHRYSVDGEWRIPHFEKMLYDNALLASLYLDGYTVTGNSLYRSVGEQTLDYMMREMRAPEGGFFSAQDAGDVGKEGEFYSWTQDEISRSVAPEVCEEICRLYGVSAAGNFEHGRSVLMVASDEDRIICERGDIRAARAALLSARDARKRPHTDEKILAGWNGLSISALCRGFQVLRRRDLLDHALAAADFIERELVLDGRLHRRYCGGSRGIPAMLEDYAYVIRGYLHLFEATGDAAWLDRASALQREQDKYLWSGERRAYLTSAAAGLIVRLCDWVDGATPSPNSIALLNVLVMAELSGDPYFGLRARALEEGIPSEAASIPMLYMTAVQGALLRMVGCASCCVVSAKNTSVPPEEVAQLWSKFLPFARLVWKAEGRRGAEIMDLKAPCGEKSAIYVCRSGTCGEPTVDVEVALSLCSAPSLANGG